MKRKTGRWPQPRIRVYTIGKRYVVGTYLDPAALAHATSLGWLPRVHHGSLPLAIPITANSTQTLGIVRMKERIEKKMHKEKAMLVSHPQGPDIPRKESPTQLYVCRWVRREVMCGKADNVQQGTPPLTRTNTIRVYTGRLNVWDLGMVDLEKGSSALCDGMMRACKVSET